MIRIKQIMSERQAALDIIDGITSGGYNNLKLKDYLKNAGLTAIQKNLVTELVNGVMRNYIYLDYLIARFCETKKIKPFIRNLLRLSVYQIVFTDKIPAYAAINEAVALCRNRGFGNLSGFVNAVLRKINDNWKNVQLPDRDKNLTAHLSVKYAVPEWIVDMWQNEYGDDVCERICEAQALRSYVTVCVNTLKTDAKSLAAELERQGVGHAAPSQAHENALLLSGVTDMAALQAFKEGLFHVMDLSAILAVDMLNAANNGTALDMCAAPGGKTFYTAQRYKARVTACDIYPHKLRLISETAARLGLGPDINVLQADATVFDPDFAGRFDAVVVDAPCSGLGVLRKKPDIKLKRTEDDIVALAALQEKILRNAAGYVKPGGTVLYCACTLSKRENEDQTASFLENGGFRLDAQTRIMPFDYNSDGYYVARMIKVK